MKKLLAICLAGLALCGCDYTNNSTPAPEAGKIWTDVGYATLLKTVVIEGHTYLVTIRNGSYSYNASTIHAESCPCRAR